MSKVWEPQFRIKWKNLYTAYFFSSYHSLTDYGACSNILPVLDFENPFTRDLTNRQYNGTFLNNITYGVRNGINNGLEIFADAETFDYAYFFRDSSGFMVGMANNKDKAIINQRGFYMRPGTINLISMTAEVTSATSRIISRFNPDLRTCYNDDEFTFKHLKKEQGYRYSIDNCLYEVVLQKVIQNCECVPFFVTVAIGVSLPKCR